MSSSSVNELFARLDEAMPNISQSLLAPIRGVAFWIAIALPFLYMPLLVSGLRSSSVKLAFGVLVATNAVALLVGHSHARE